MAHSVMMEPGLASRALTPVNSMHQSSWALLPSDDCQVTLVKMSEPILKQFHSVNISESLKPSRRANPYSETTASA